MKLKAVLRIRTSGGSSSRDPQLCKELELPFTPFVGLDLVDSKSGFELTIENLTWNVIENRFETYLEDREIPSTIPYNSSDERIEQQVLEYFKDGWMLENG
jgi:hypothetical protein